MFRSCGEKGTKLQTRDIHVLFYSLSIRQGRPEQTEAKEI